MKHLAAAPTLALIVAVSLAAHAPQGGMPPQGQATFRVQVELVEVDVFPAGPDGQFVATLTRDDFEVLEDGRPQTISTFALVNIPRLGTDAPRPPSGSASAESDVQTNAASGRLYVIVLDDLHTARAFSGYVQTHAARFIERWIEPGDVAAVVYASGIGALSQGFTSDKARLLASVRRFQGGSGGGMRADGTRVAVATLTGLSEYLAELKGRRKICVYFSHGFPASTPSSEFRDVTNAANRGNVSLYAVNSAGLADLANLVTAEQPSVVQGQSRADARARVRDVRVREDGLRRLADETGGFAIVGTNNLDGGLDRIQRDASSYYLLGYYPAAAGSPGAEHKITVRVRNRPGVSIRARRGYAVPREPASSSPPPLPATNVPPRLLPALRYPIPQGGIRLSAMAASFKSETGSPWAIVTVEFDGRDLDLSPSGTLDVAVLAIDAKGTVRGHDVRRIDLSFDASTRSGILEHGLRAQARVPVAPGVIGIRVAAADGAGPRVGSLWFDLDVPDYERTPLSMSGIVLSDGAAGAVLTANADEELQRALQAPASTRRAFTPNDNIAWLADVYRAVTGDAAVEITTTIRAAVDGREVFRQRRQAEGGESTTRLMARTPLAGFAPGGYVLRVDARHNGGTGIVSRELRFRVVEAAR
jgi:VWFA-related protein